MVKWVLVVTNFPATVVKWVLVVTNFPATVVKWVLVETNFPATVVKWVLVETNFPATVVEWGTGEQCYYTDHSRDQTRPFPDRQLTWLESFRCCVKTAGQTRCQWWKPRSFHWW